MERPERAGRRRRNQVEADLPDQFQYAIGTDLQRQQSLQHRLRRARPAGDELSATLDLRRSQATRRRRDASTCRTFASRPTRTGSPTARLGFKANVATRVLVNFNLRFSIGQTGLSDRIAPLLGVEWAF